MTIDASEQVQEFSSVLVQTHDDNKDLQHKPPPAATTCLAVQENKPCLDDQLRGKKTSEQCNESANAYCPCPVTVDIERGNLDKLKINEETVGSVNSEMSLTKPLRRQNSLQPAGGEPAKPFMNHILMLLKLDAKDKQTTERAHDVPNNRWRKYKRAAGFDSRQIVLLFSILSSVGTMVLIYLTLRVRQAGESFVLI